jgi:DNA-directed RNA polymerase I, II, and III subunit RPABC4
MSSSNANANATSTFDQAATASSMAAQVDRPTTYICGDCNAKVVLKRADAVRCQTCGHRVLYKERTTRYAANQGAMPFG